VHQSAGIRHPQRTTTLDRALGERQCAGPRVLANKLANQGGTVETAVRHPSCTPSERASVQPKEDKSRRSVWDG
jgi:hypothetical protein